MSNWPTLDALFPRKKEKPVPVSSLNDRSLTFYYLPMQTLLLFPCTLLFQTISIYDPPSIFSTNKPARGTLVQTV